MLTLSETQISTQYHQLNPGGDLAALVGMSKALLAMDDEAKAAGGGRAIDVDFIAQDTSGFDAFVASMRPVPMAGHRSVLGLDARRHRSAASVYRNAKAVIACYGMGLTQHRSGVLAIQMLSNLLLMRGNIGKPGAGIFPVRGHSNVQGQRTVGITEKPELVPLDRLAEQYGFDPPRERGLNTVEACEGVRDRSVKAFISLGGNFIRAIPETDIMERAWRHLELTVQIVTKLNRGALIHGKAAYLLPCLGRIEIDRQATGVQFVTVEDTTGRFHASHGQVEPASEHLLVGAENRRRAGQGNSCRPIRRSTGTPGAVTTRLCATQSPSTYPKIFANFNERIKNPSGFDRPLPARERKWTTPNWQGQLHLAAQPVGRPRYSAHARGRAHAHYRAKQRPVQHDRLRLWMTACAASTARAWSC